MIINLIKEEYSKIINEIGSGTSNKYEFILSSKNKNESRYKFTTDLNTEYTVDIIYEKTNKIDGKERRGLYVDFFTGDEDEGYKIENKGEIYKVMATVVEIIKKHMASTNENIEYISFIADSKRSKLYDKYMEKYSVGRFFDKYSGSIYYLFNNKM